MEEATLVFSPVSCPTDYPAQETLSEQEKHQLNKNLKDVLEEIRASIYLIYPEFARLILRSFEEGRALDVGRLQKKFNILLNG